MIEIDSAAKLNLFLHVTGQRDDGYHLLDSGVMFCEFGDKIYIEPADNFSFTVSGPFSSLFDNAMEEDNLVVQAAYFMRRHFDRDLNFRITLEKNIPIGAGLGGGSANAASVVQALLKHWDIQGIDRDTFALSLLGLGADVPACFFAKPHYLYDIGLTGQRFSVPEDIPVLLVYPGKGCSTPAVFENYAARQPLYSKPIDAQAYFVSNQAFIDFLKSCDNELTQAAMAIVPDIQDVLDVMQRQRGAQLTRMTGSGSCCFSLFDDESQCLEAEERVRSLHSRWWVKATTLKSS